MKSIHACGALLALSALCLTATAQGTANYGSSSLLPLPEFNLRYPARRQTDVSPAAHNLTAGWDNPNSPTSVEEIIPNGEYYPSFAAPAPAQAPGQYPSINQPDVQYDIPGIGGCSGCGIQHAYGSCGKGAGRYGGGGLHSLWEPKVNAYGEKAGCGWFGGASGLLMSRANDDHFYFSFGDAAESFQQLDVQEVEMEWAGGGEVRIGHFFNCGQNAWEIVYWGIFPFQQESTLVDVNVNGALNAILNFDQLSINVVGVPTVVGDWVDNADAHRLRRDFDFHNVEFNVWNYTGCSAVGCRSRITYNWGFGGRYFRVDEMLQFSAKENGSGVVFDDSTNQINYDVDVDNNLIGAQVIGNGQYFLNNCLSFSVGTKVGVYANVINHRSRIYNIDGTAFVNNGPNNGAEFDVTSSKNDVALMAELNVGFNYQFNQRWNAYSGYRALGITSLATATGQIPRDLRGVQDVQIIDSNDGVLLHGFYFGGMYNW